MSFNMAFRFPTRANRLDRLFIALVLIPTLLSAIYFGFIASDVYISESRFVVRSPERQAPGGLGLVLAGAGFNNAGEEANAAKAFVESREALRRINSADAFREAYTRPGISVFDRFDPLGLDGSFEKLYNYYLHKVVLEADVTTGILTLQVHGYTPADAHRFNERLLEMSEQTINQMNSRGRADLIRFAQFEVAEAQNRAREAGVAIAAYRNREGIVDPEMQATAQMAMVSKLQDEVIATETQLAQLREFTPRNPQIGAFENRLRTLRAAVRREMSALAGGNRSLADTAAQFEKLTLEQEFAGKQLTSALASLQEARNEARRQQVYVERIAAPSRPDAPVQPRRLRGVLATLALGLLAWGVASMLRAGVREHAQ
jgi:capsular polysaccharide transport system permease protein